MDQFKFIGRATLVHINTRKEGNEDEKELAVDLKLTTRVQGEKANFFGEGLRDFLFTNAGETRFVRMNDIGFSHKLHNYRVILEDGQEHYGAELKGFVLSPVKNGLLDLTFTVSFKPISQILAFLAEFLQEQISIDLAPQNQELDFGNKSEELIEKLSGVASGVGEGDPLYDQAKAYVIESKKASVSALQRQLRIGYNRAARLIEAMEQSAIVSTMQSDSTRNVI